MKDRSALQDRHQKLLAGMILSNEPGYYKPGTTASGWKT